MAIDEPRHRVYAAVNLFHSRWSAFAHAGLADGVGGSQYLRAYGEWRCQGSPQPTVAWIREWLERDEAFDPGEPFEEDEEG